MGKLFSRNNALKKSVLKIDSGSKKVLDTTDSWIFDYVRLYFRPRTPMLFQVEGFCPGGKCSSKFKAHCPVPIYLLFDSVKVFGIPNIKFSNGNLSSHGCCVFDDITNLKDLPFDQIYHDSYLEESYKRQIIFNRHAEVIVENELPLDNYLSGIICRSAAERETLINHLSNDSRKKYSKSIKVWNPCFFSKQQYIRNVSLFSDKIEIEYNKNQLNYNYKYYYENDIRNSERIFDYPINSFSFNYNDIQYEFSIFIDDHIAYKGEYYDLPF